MVSKEVARRGVLDSKSVVNFCPASNTTINTLALTQWQVGNVLSQVLCNGYLTSSEQERCATWSVLSPHGSPLLLRAYPRPPPPSLNYFLVLTIPGGQELEKNRAEGPLGTRGMEHQGLIMTILCDSHKKGEDVVSDHTPQNHRFRPV